MTQRTWYKRDMRKCTFTLLAGCVSLASFGSTGCSNKGKGAASADQQNVSLVQVTPRDRTLIEGDIPTLRVKSPRSGLRFRRDVRLRVQVRGWPLEPGPGRHVHLILDNEPYIAIRDLRKPLNINQLVRDKLKKELSPGMHVVRMFPSRSHHESVKEGTPFASFVFHNQTRSDLKFDPKAPLLTYSRPKGCSPANSDIMLDFYLSNIDELSDSGYQVRYTVGDLGSGLINAWVPYSMKGIPVGTHDVTLELLFNGEAVEGRFNKTTRTITVAETCS